MGLFKKTAEETAAVAAYKAAKKALDANQQREEAAGIREETDTSTRLSADVSEAMQNVPWYRR